MPNSNKPILYLVQMYIIDAIPDAFGDYPPNVTWGINSKCWVHSFNTLPAQMGPNLGILYYMSRHKVNGPDRFEYNDSDYADDDVCYDNHDNNFTNIGEKCGVNLACNKRGRRQTKQPHKTTHKGRSTRRLSHIDFLRCPFQWTSLLYVFVCFHLFCDCLSAAVSWVIASFAKSRLWSVMQLKNKNITQEQYIEAHIWLVFMGFFSVQCRQSWTPPIHQILLLQKEWVLLRSIMPHKSCQKHLQIVQSMLETRCWEQSC